MHIIGAGNHAKVVVEILKQSGYEISAVWDDNIEAVLMGYPVKGSIEEFEQADTDQLIVAIGNNSTRKTVAIALKQQSAIRAIHPSSSVSISARIGKGTVIMPNASINAEAIVGSHVIINTNASVDHDCRLGDYVHVSPQAGLAGNVTVGEGTHIGIGACVVQGIKIGRWATIGAGAVVIRDVPDYAVVVGNPGRIIKYNDLNWEDYEKQ